MMLKYLSKIVLWIMWMTILWTGAIFAQAWNLPTNGSFKAAGWANGINIWWTANAQGDNILNVVKTIVNYVIWLLGLISLVVLLYGGFQMVTAAGDDKKYGAGFTIVKQSAIWLALIGTAYFIVSIVFYIIWAATWL